MSYIVLSPLMIGLFKDFLCHFHLGLLHIHLLFFFILERFPHNDFEDGTLKLYCSSGYCMQDNITFLIARSLGSSNKWCFLYFSSGLTSIPIRGPSK